MEIPHRKHEFRWVICLTMLRLQFSRMHVFWDVKFFVSFPYYDNPSLDSSKLYDLDACKVNCEWNLHNFPCLGWFLCHAVLEVMVLSSCMCFELKLMSSIRNCA